jgi:hypothetical protein
MLTKEDIQFIEKKGILVSEIEAQYEKLKKGFIPAELVEPATTDKGILELSENKRKYYISIFEHYSQNRDIIKFVPASGAASRMFKDLLSFIQACKKEEFPPHTLLEKHPHIDTFFSNIHQFAFFPILEKKCYQNNINLSQLLENKDYVQFIELLLFEKGLNYSNLPKALIDFHNYSEFQRKAIEEHMVEAALYAVNANGSVQLHFTISPEHQALFDKHILRVKPIFEEKFGITYNISFSYQNSKTDTIAIDNESNILRNEKGQIVFRPGGHGALTDNLNSLNGDLIFIKNIDNVTIDRFRESTIEYKKILAGVLLEKEITINNQLALLMEEECGSEEIKTISNFVRHEVLISLPPDFEAMPIEKQRRILINKLNRPIRVCGMVKNDGEPGGGPFFVRDSKGIESLQIIESAQVDFSNDEQRAVFKASTHFNPVDIVANTIDFLGRKFNLQDFIDSNTYIVTNKSVKGKPVRVLERPGLWNGAMAKWITFFVEVPIETFTPVKEINDLLRPQHIYEQ